MGKGAVQGGKGAGSAAPLVRGVERSGGFLGGLGEIGRNCACIKIKPKDPRTDVGIMFPDPDIPGSTWCCPTSPTSARMRMRSTASS